MKIIHSPKIMIVSDLDGTIFDQNGFIPENIKKITDISDDVIFSVATARPPHEVSKLKIFPLDKINYSICLDGGIITSNTNHHFDLLYESLIPSTSAQQIITKLLSDLHLTELFIFTGSENNYEIYHFSDGVSDDLDEIKQFQSGRSIVSYAKQEAYGLANELSIRSISTFSKGTSIDKDICPNDCMLIKYHETRKPTVHKWIDIISKKTNKEVAVKELCRLLSFSGTIIALGNGHNDIDLISSATISYVPNDAINEIKAIASYVATSSSGRSFIEEIVPHLSVDIQEIKEMKNG